MRHRDFPRFASVKVRRSALRGSRWVRANTLRHARRAAPDSSALQLELPSAHIAPSEPRLPFCPNCTRTKQNNVFLFFLRNKSRCMCTIAYACESEGRPRGARSGYDWRPLRCDKWQRRRGLAIDGNDVQEAVPSMARNKTVGRTFDNLGIPMHADRFFGGSSSTCAQAWYSCTRRTELYTYECLQ